MKYSVVIPLYNESDNIEPLHRRLTDVMSSLPGEYEIIFVNDGSADSSGTILKDVAQNDKRTVVINLAKNFGQHPAVIAGFKYAKGEVIITLDADLQNPPEEIPRLLDELEKGYDEVSGKRKMRKDSLLRKIPSFFVNLIISFITGVWLEDYGSMLRVFKRDTANGVIQAFLERQAYITMLIPKVTKNIKEIEVEHSERFEGESKYGFFRLIEAFVRIFFAKKGTKESSIQDIFRVGSIISEGEETIVHE